MTHINFPNDTPYSMPEAAAPSTPAFIDHGFRDSAIYPAILPHTDAASVVVHVVRRE